MRNAAEIGKEGGEHELGKGYTLDERTLYRHGKIVGPLVKDGDGWVCQGPGDVIMNVSKNILDKAGEILNA